MTNPFADPYLILSKVYLNGQFLKQAIAATPVEPQNKSRTVKICYGVLDKDCYLEHIIGANTAERPKTAVRIILKIALYMLEFMGKHDYMVVDSAVALTKKLGKGGAAGFVNAFLRSYKLPPEPANKDEAIALRCSAPLWLVKKIRRSYKDEAEEILNAPSLGQGVRFVGNAQGYLDKPHTDTPFKEVYIFDNFERDEGFFCGEYTFQSVGSAAICNAISPCERLLDACAAPGGKSAYLSLKCKSVVSCELHPHRVKLIEEYFARMGVKNATAMQADSSVFNPDFENAFDAVLCDVPCSGTGVINENPDIKLNRKEGDIPVLSKLQLEILTNCSRYVKSGGILYYSTCSILPEENDSVAVSFLNDNPNFTLSIPSSPLTHKATKYGLQFLPHISLGAGFYLTAFIKA
ncbi:MAG: transcription antitermination factor NusB [Candidatus Coproplasma sp.]